MKKIVLMLLCAVLLLSGCSQQKAEPYYETTGEGISMETQYKYYFSDEKSVFCTWYNETDAKVNFYDTFELHELGKDGVWYKVENGEEPVFITSYSHAVEPDGECRAEYDISVYAKDLDEGKTYRISTFYFDADGNNYQIYAEFLCDADLAEEEMLEISDGMVGNRKGDSINQAGGSLTVIEKEPKTNG